MIAAVYARKSSITVLFCALTLTGCQLYWRKPGANLAAFTADHQTCVAKAGSDVGAAQVLVNLDVYRACLKVHGWQRETGSKASNPAGFYRGLEDEGPMPVGHMPKQVGETEGSATTATSREMFCRRVNFEGRSDWRDRITDYQRCLAQ
jgi:hypothetical protein